MRVLLIVMDHATLNHILTKIIMIAMEHAPQSIYPVMESVSRDMLTAMDGVINLILMSTVMIAMEHLS